MKYTDEDKEMVARLIRVFEHDLEELHNDKYGHAEIVSDLKESCREKIDWLEAFQKRMEQEPNDDTVNSRLLDEDTYKAPAVTNIRICNPTTAMALQMPILNATGLQIPPSGQSTPDVSVRTRISTGGKVHAVNGGSSPLSSTI